MPTHSKNQLKKTTATPESHPVAATNASQNNEALKMTFLRGKYYWHDPRLNLEHLCNYLPVQDKRNHLRVTVISQFIFYHDRDFNLNAADFKSQTLIKQLNEAVNMACFINETSKYEYLLTLAHINTKLCRLSSGNSIAWATNKCLIYELLNETESCHESDLNNNNATASTSLNESNKKKKSQKWSINGWLNGVKNKRVQQLSQSNTTPDGLTSQLSELSVGEPTESKTEPLKKCTLNEREKEKIRSYIFSSSSFSASAAQINHNHELLKSQFKKIQDTNNNEVLPLNKKIVLNEKDLSVSNVDDVKTRSPLLHKFLNKNKINRPSAQANSADTALKADPVQVDCCHSMALKPIESSYSIKSFQCGEEKLSSLSSKKSDYYREPVIRDVVKKFFENKAKKWRSFPHNLVDTHCHFDMMFSR